MTPEQRAAYEIWLASLIDQNGATPIGWLYQQVPQDGRYAGNGENDAWIVWQAYNNVFGNGQEIGRNEQGAELIQSLIAD